jgi:hypothetical protein
VNAVSCLFGVWSVLRVELDGAIGEVTEGDQIEAV